MVSEKGIMMYGVIDVESLRLKRLYLEGYVIGKRKIINVDGKEYEIVQYQGDHDNEYLISEMKDGRVNGRCELYNKGLLSLSWEIRNGNRVGRVSEYYKGKAVCRESWNDLLESTDHRMIENNKKGLVLVIRNRDTNAVIYRGECDEKWRRNGKGIAYDPKSGDLSYEGYWHNDELVCICKEFNGEEMTEYEEYDNVDVLNRVPIYVGGYVVNDDEEIYRNGKGYLIDKNNGTVIREGEWSNGVELRGVDLFNGWYMNGISDSIRRVLNNEKPPEITRVINMAGRKVQVKKASEFEKIDFNAREF